MLSYGHGARLGGGFQINPHCAQLVVRLTRADSLPPLKTSSMLRACRTLSVRGLLHGRAVRGRFLRMSLASRVFGTVETKQNPTAKT